MENQQEGKGKTTSAPPPDWYENEEGVLQWWDGEKWGPVAPGRTIDPPRQQAIKSDPASTVTPSVPSNPARSVKARNPLGIWSVILGIVAILLLIAPGTDPLAAVVLSGIGLILGAFGLGLRTYLGLGRPGLLSRSRTSAVWGVVLTALAMLVALIAVFSQPSVSTGTVSAGSTRSVEDAPEVVQPNEPQPSAEEQRNAQMEEQGFHTWQSGEVWLKAVDPESFTCDYGTRCIWYQLVSYSGCASGYYVKADILNANDVAIGWTNEITASVQPQDGVVFQLRSADNGGETIKVSEVSCMG